MGLVNGSQIELPLDQIRAQAESSLYFFTKAVLGFSDLSLSVHFPLCKFLEKQSQYRMAVLPRGWFKTTVVSIAYRLWRAVKNPELKTLLIQNTFTNAVAKNRAIRSIVETNELFRTLWPGLLPSKLSTWRDDSLCLQRHGAYPESTFECAGVGTKLVSRHYDLIIEDDTVAPDQNELGEDNLVPTKDDIDQAIGYHRLVTPLMVSPGESQSLVVGTRWFDLDLISWIQTNQSWYKTYIRASREKDGVPDEDGPATFPERFPDRVLDQIQADMGPYLFSCLYMNKPLRSEDMLFKADWFQYYDAEPMRMMTYISVDPGGDPETSLGKPDPWVVMTCGKDFTTGRSYVLEYVRKAANPGAMVSEMFRQAEKWGVVVIGIESVAYQKQLLYWVRQQMAQERKFFRIVPINDNKRSKNARISGLQPLVYSGKILFRKHMKDLVNELLVFPLGKNDDLADALAMQLELWQVNGRMEEKRVKSRDEENPLTLDYALKSIDEKAKGKSRGFIFDVLEPAASN